MNNQAPSELPRTLGLFDATFLIIGNIIGVGIFTTTGFMAEAAPHPLLILGLWLVGGLLTLTGALTYAELGGALPRAGGEYIYLREAYGPFIGFLNGWTYFTVTNAGSIALMAVASAAYLDGGKLMAILIVLVFSIVNYLGIGFGSAVQNILTAAKTVGILSFAVFGLALGKGDWANFTASSSGTGLTLDALSLAMIAVFFSYTGWFTSTFVASEIKNPERNIPKSIIYGTVAVSFIYLLVNVGYLYALPVAKMKSVVNVGETAAQALFGAEAGTYISAAIVLSILGALNSVILTAPRIYYAMAKDGLFFKAAAVVHRRFRTPANSIVIQALWCCFLVGSGSFEQLLTYTTVAMLAFSILTGSAVFLLRVRRPDLPRPYRTPGYPWIPAVFVVSYVLILLHVAWARPLEALLGMGILALGAPVYWFWRRPLRHSAPAESAR